MILINKHLLCTSVYSSLCSNTTHELCRMIGMQSSTLLLSVCSSLDGIRLSICSSKNPILRFGSLIRMKILMEMAAGSCFKLKAAKVQMEMDSNSVTICRLMQGWPRPLCDYPLINCMRNLYWLKYVLLLQFVQRISIGMTD